MRRAAGNRGARQRNGDAGGHHSPEVVALSRELTAHNLQEIGRADGKAAILLALAGTLLGLLLMRRPADLPWALLPWWVAVVTATGASVFCLLALLPRRDLRAARQARVLAYYDDVVSAAERDELWVSLRLSGTCPRAQLLRALAGTSRIAQAKNRWVRCAVLALLPSVTAAFLALVAGR